MCITRPVFLLICLLGALSACRPGTDDDPPVVVTSEPEFRIDAYEQRDSATGATSLGLWVESLATYDCAGYQVRSALRITGQQIEVELLDVQRPANCSGAPAPARTFVPIGPLATGRYPLRLSLGKTILNDGWLTVENDRFTLDFPQPQGIVIQNYTAYHLPEALLWGYVVVPDEASNMAAQSFISELKTITADNGLPPGFYSYFTVSGSGGVFFHSGILPAGAVVMFVRKLTAPPPELKNLLQNYRAGGGQQPALAVRCFSTSGEF